MQSCKCQLYIHDRVASFIVFFLSCFFIVRNAKGANTLLSRQKKELFYEEHSSVLYSTVEWSDCLEKGELCETAWVREAPIGFVSLSSVCSPTRGVNIERAPLRVGAPAATRSIRLFMCCGVLNTNVQHVLE